MYRSITLKCFLLCVFLEGAISYQDVEIDSGMVRGYKAVDGDYLAYIGIPYAEPPLGDLRFKAPIPPSPWNDTLNATRIVECPQRNRGAEDCLVVNVFTPTTIHDEPLPVIVYVHGGGYIVGSGQAQRVETLIKQNIILVTFNYRLGVLGFLCLGVDEAPGNAGMKDQVAALEWVQRNIRAFGGDPKNVTAYGMSAGAASVDLLMLSDMAKGLFHKAIIESGAATSVWSVNADPIRTASDFAKLFVSESNFEEADSNNLNALADLYRKLSADQLSVDNAEYFGSLVDGTLGFVPCVEKRLLNTTPFITESPHNILKNYGYITKVPTMFIFASSEGLYLRSTEYSNYKDRMQENFRDFMVADLIFETEEIRENITDYVNSYYFGNNTVGDNTLTEYLNYFGDSFILHGLLNSVLIHAENKEDVYLMEFAYKGEIGMYDEIFEHLNLAGHSEALKHVILEKAVENEHDRKAVERMAMIIANFAKSSNPIPEITEQLPLHWPVVRPNNVTYLRFDRELQLLEKPSWERKVFWDELYDAYRRDIRPVGSGIL